MGLDSPGEGGPQVAAATQVGDQPRVADRIASEGRRRKAGAPQVPLDPGEQGVLFHKEFLRIAVLSLFHWWPGYSCLSRQIPIHFGANVEQKDLRSASQRERSITQIKSASRMPAPSPIRKP